MLKEEFEAEEAMLAVEALVLGLEGTGQAIKAEGGTGRGWRVATDPQSAMWHMRVATQFVREGGSAHHTKTSEYNVVLARYTIFLLGIFSKHCPEPWAGASWWRWRRSCLRTGGWP